MGTAERRARAKENLRRAILDAARELFVTEDFKAVSMRRIAEKIEYSPTTIYLHFKDKEAILHSLSEEGFALLSARLEKIDTPDPLARLREGGHAYLRFALAQPQYYKIMFELEDNRVDKEDEDSMAHRAFGFIRRCVTEGVAGGAVTDAVPEPLLSHVIWASVHGAASLALAGRLGMLPPEAHDSFFDALVEATLRGIRRDGGAG